MLDLEPDFWRSRRVLLTGHTGFKGSWLALWLEMLGARTFGFALPPSTTPNLFGLLALPTETFADVRDREQLEAAFNSAQPEVVFHLAAQSLVLPSYKDPVATFATNVMGTVNVIDVARRTDCVRSMVIVTSDKCYRHVDERRPHGEDDPLGGQDPYSASKGATEIVVESMRRSYFRPYRPDGHQARIATARAGNVIGGGDWADHRLVPDIVRGAAAGEIVIRNPDAVRPWQHVFEPLAAYLGLAQQLCETGCQVDTAFNFGPDQEDERSVMAMAEEFTNRLGSPKLKVLDVPAEGREAEVLRLNCDKARGLLDWRPRWGFEQMLEMTASWYLAHAAGKDLLELSKQQILAFMADSPY